MEHVSEIRPDSAEIPAQEIKKFQSAFDPGFIELPTHF
jgi:hypothetical protein